MKKKIPNIVIKIPHAIYEAAIVDLNRDHPFASERVGFFSTNIILSTGDLKIVSVTDYSVVDDTDYIDDSSVGAKISANAIRKAMEKIISSGHGCMHVHMHNHFGRTSPSGTDLRSLPALAETFYNTDDKTPAGYFIFSKDSFYSAISIGGDFNLQEVNQVSIVGSPMKFLYSKKWGSNPVSDQFSRQSFLGADAQSIFETVNIGIVGLGGGGSHVVQQLAHIGFRNFYIFDDDYIEPSNHNRLIGGWFVDIAKKLKKILIAKRLIKKINPKAKVHLFPTKWQQNSDALKMCDVVIGCVDSYNERFQLESACRSALIPSVDIGMDVYKMNNGHHSIAGQIILSVPGLSCMSCMDFINEEKLSLEAKKYGDVGGRPQVVWPNGVLASTAVGIIVDLLTGWSGEKNKSIYLAYDGNLCYINEHPRLEFSPTICLHFPLSKTGNTIFKRL